MRTKKILFAFLFLLILLFISTLFTPTTVQKTVPVALPVFRATEQFADPVNLAKWYHPFLASGSSLNIQIDGAGKKLRAGNDSVQIENLSIYSSRLTSFSGSKQKQFLLSVLPDTTNITGSLLSLSYKTTLFKKWFKTNKLETNALQSLASLADYVDDTKRLYGYDIRRVKVVDTAFLFATTSVPLAEKRAASKKLFDQLIDFAAKKNAGYNGVRIFHSQRSGNEVILFASIGVTNRITIDESEPFQYKMMPFEKNLLEATYQGPFGESHKVYTALETYKKDHGLVSMAIPFQKFLSDGYDFADEQVVQLKIYYPIF